MVIVKNLINGCEGIRIVAGDHSLTIVDPLVKSKQ